MKYLRYAVTLLLLLFCAGFISAQEKVQVRIEGKPSGTVPSVQANGAVYVDVRATARKLGADVEVFARSKQAKITARNFYAILTAPLDQVVMNTKTQPLPAPVMVERGRLMVPVDFFLMPAVGKALNRAVTFEGDTLFIEKQFTLSVPQAEKNDQNTSLTFTVKEATAFSVHKTNRHTVVAVFDKAVLQREEHFRLHTPFIQSATLSQESNRALLKIILGPKALDWGFWEDEDGRLVFEVAGAQGDYMLSGVSGQTDLSTAVSPKQTPVLTAAKRTKPEPVPQPMQAKPSVLSEGAEDGDEDGADRGAPDDFAELLAAAPAVAGKPALSETGPVLKEAPLPVISKSKKKMRIVVDPGHGGKDPGATRARYREKDWNLAVGKELAKLLKKGGFEVKITRDTDEFIALSDRSKIANGFEADLFVSIHTNSSKNRNANGFEVYFRSDKPTDKEAAETAALENEAMQYEEVHYNFVDALLESLAKNEYINESSKLAGYVSNAIYKQEGIGIAVKKNSIRQANFYVLRGVKSPSILVEMGYISSNKDRGRLSQSAVQKKVAKGIYNGIVTYAKKEGRAK